jgi:hypothetical protein
MTTVRRPAVAGMFYPDDPRELAHQLSRFLSDVEATGPAPKALIAPHAGYVYSGPVAASIYARLAGARDRIQRVVLLGPSHRVPFRGLARSSAEAFETPLGRVPVDAEAQRVLDDLPQVGDLDAAHALEHSLEVQIPFLQQVLGEFTLVPLVVGDAAPEDVARVLEALWGGDETLIVVSSDLSHYLDYDTARARDSATSERIAQLSEQPFHGEEACGCRAINGLMRAARAHGLEGEIVDLRSSGDTAGPRDRVVGYGAYGFA